jgi:hypothetical protein
MIFPKQCIFLILVLSAGCSRPTTPVVSSTAIPSEPAWFEDVTAACGLVFSHDPGPITKEYFMPQIAGSGCAFFDFDGDNLLDIYLIHNGGPDGKKNQLFHQERDGVFRDVSEKSGVDVSGYGMGVAVGDIDNDGKPDLLLTEYGATRLFRNLGKGRFLDITKEAGIDNPLWGTSASFFDYDRDGWLDLVIVNYIDYDRSIPCPRAGGKLDFCGPHIFRGSLPRLFRNTGHQANGSVRFEDTSLTANLVNGPKGKGLGVLCADFDGDGWPDIFIANDLIANHLWINQHDGKFKEEATLRGLAYTWGGAAAANMGIGWADVDGDGLPDIFVTHILDENHTLWMQGPRGFYQDKTLAAGLTARSTGFGTAFVDFDRDGWPDLAFVNGNVRRNPGAENPNDFWSSFAQRNVLYANQGKGKFRDISQSNPALCEKPVVGRGLAVGDFDNDGAPDLLITEINGPARLLRNTASAHGHWLTVRAAIPKLKRDAYGAEITVRAGGQSYWRLLQPGYSYCSSNDPRCFFGLGKNTRYDSIEVLWPDGVKESFGGGDADRFVEIHQGDGKSLVPSK